MRCADDSLYTGIATDVARRFQEHSSGAKGAKYLQGRRPLKLAFHCTVGDRAAASRVEYRLKRLTKSSKEDYLGRPLELREHIATLASQ